MQTAGISTDKFIPKPQSIRLADKLNTNPNSHSAFDAIPIPCTTSSMHKNQSKRLAKYSKRIRPPKPVKNPPLIYNSWWATLLLPALLAVIGGLLAWLIFSNTKALWLTNTLPLAFVMFVSVFPASNIRLSEHSSPPKGHTTYKVIYRLTQDVSPSVREALLQLPLFQKKLLLAYTLLLILPISLIYFWQSVTSTFWHMHVLPSACLLYTSPSPRDA